jgi:Flp pilus assembly protein TadB
MLKVVLLAACATLVAAPAAAMGDETPVSAEKKIVCKRVKNTGWRLSSEKVCKTAKEWADMSNQTRKQLRDAGRSGAGPNN